MICIILAVHCSLSLDLRLGLGPLSLGSWNFESWIQEAWFSHYNYAASNVLLMTTLSLHSFMRSSQAESIIAAVSWLALRRRRPTSCDVSWAARIVSNTRKFDRGLTHFRRSQLHWLDVVDRARISLRPGVQMSAQDGSWIPVNLLPIRLRHFWSSPPAIGCAVISPPQLPTCETCFVRRTFICIRRPFKLELTSCSL